MGSFQTILKSEYGRLGELHTASGVVETPAFFPVANLIAGTTPKSGGIWRYARRHLFQSEDLQGIMFQTMTFLNYNLSPNSLDNWREKPLKLHFEESQEEPTFDCPLFVDSGGFQLMNSTTFGDPPSEGGSTNEWGIFTNPDSILSLQLDFGADIVATLDFPIPPNLKSSEVTERMERSIDNAVECLNLLDERGSADRPAVYVAIHGQSYEDVNWYVSKFMDRAGRLDDNFEGFALGSLVPLSNSPETLVDIIQGAKDAIPESRFSEIALHVFGISGRLCPLLVLLGVDSFDSANYLRAARNKSFIHPESWRRIKLEDIQNWEEWPCRCNACQRIHLGDMRHALLETEVSYQKIEGEHATRWKSEYYAEIAYHNYELYSQQMSEVREAVAKGELLELVAEFAEDKDIVKKGLKRAQFHNPTLRDEVADAGYKGLLAGSDTQTFQSKLSNFLDTIGKSRENERTISLKHGPDDFNILQYSEYSPAETASILLILPCSQEKPYSDSRTQQAVLSRLEEFRGAIHKVSISGLYGPVPEEFEKSEPVMSYEYVLTPVDEGQIGLIADRLNEYLSNYGDQFDKIFAYCTSKAYRQAIEEAFRRYGRGEVYPANPQALQLTEHFREENIDELVEKICEIV